MSATAATRRKAAEGRRPSSRPVPSSRPRSAGPRPRSRPNARRLPVAIAALIALVILGTSFPAAALLKQHQQLASSSAQLQKLQHQNQLLSQQQQQLNSKAEIQRLARQDYQLVLTGQTLFNVLPPTGQAGAAVGSSTVTPGDPGSQPLVSPADAPNMTPDPGLPQGGTAGTTGTSSSGSSPTGPTGSSTGSSSAASPGGFWHRVTTTLEFWR
jgi:cell division protein FtsB